MGRAGDTRGSGSGDEHLAPGRRRANPGRFAESTSNPHVIDHARAVEATRIALGSPRYEELEARGAAMTYEQMVDYALHELRRPLDTAEQQPPTLPSPEPV